jgi:methionyl-tRNA synthetase
MLRPFLPQSSNAILKYFGVADPLARGSAGLRPEDIAKPGQPLGKPEVLFKKLEPKDMPEAK